MISLRFRSIGTAAFTLALTLLAGLSPAAAQTTWSTNGHTYLAVNAGAPLTWEAANSAAISAGGYLATLTSAEENAFVFSLVDNPIYWASSPDGAALGAWLGGTQAPSSPEPAGGWQWVTGESWGLTAWAPGEPTNGLGSGHGMPESRLHFFNQAGARTATWNDLPSGFAGPNSYVIEFDPTAVPEPGALALLLPALFPLAVVSLRRRSK